MNREEIVEIVTNIIKNAIENKNITITTSTLLVEELHLESFAIIMIMNDLEDEFNVTIEDDAFENLRIVDDVVHFVEKLLAK